MEMHSNLIMKQLNNHLINLLHLTIHTRSYDRLYKDRYAKVLEKITKICCTILVSNNGKDDLNYLILSRIHG
ncbi:hypothetical protein GCM10027566_15220 [Arachidicoccus ginsenosidivorans]